MVEPLRIGVLSTAKIGMRNVTPAMQATESCEVVAVASRNLDAAGAAARLLDISTAHGSYEALLEDPQVEAIYNPLPNHLHAEWSIAAAKAGKHVLCEKPRARSAEEAQSIVAACEASGVVLMEAFMYRLHSSWREAVRLVHDGSIGPLRAVHTASATSTTISRASGTSPNTGRCPLRHRLLLRERVAPALRRGPARRRRERRMGRRLGD